MTSLATVYRRASDVRYRILDDEAVVIRQRAGEVLGLNALGARLLDALDGVTPVGEIVADLAPGYAVERQELERDALGFYAELAALGLIEEQGAAGGAGAMSGFGGKVESIWRENRLFTVLLELTYRCNLDCFFCYNDVSLKGTPLATEQYFSLLDELAELGTLQLSLSGGEPLAHPDFFRIGARARELGFVVRIKSNGHALRDVLARRVRDEIDPYAIEVSLHGARAETHDRQTRVPGSFTRLVENLGGLAELGLRVKINSTLTAYNEGEIEGMFAIADSLGFPLQIDPDVTPRDNGDLEPLVVRASRAGLVRLFEIETERGSARAATMGETPAADAATAGQVAAVQRQGDADQPRPASGKHCGAGSSNIAIDPYGNVYPCVQWRRPVGNLHQASIREIWSTSPALAGIRQLVTEIPGRLQASGPAAHLLNFCPGAAELATGDAGAVYAAAALRKEVLQEMADAESRPRKRARLPVVS